MKNPRRGINLIYDNCECVFRLDDPISKKSYFFGYLRQYDLVKTLANNLFKSRKDRTYYLTLGEKFKFYLGDDLVKTLEGLVKVHNSEVLRRKSLTSVIY